jgi:molecular chaperone GrpE
MTEFKPDSTPMELDLSDEEIEIIEVVGLDEDSPAAWPIRDEAEVSTLEEETEGEIVLDLDEDPQHGVEQSREARPGTMEAPHFSDREQLLRITADFENLKKRVDRTREAVERHAAAQLVSRLLPVLDNFERALSAARQVERDATFQDGIGLIFRQLLDELRKEGLVAVDTVGEPFDPELHEAVATTEGSGLPANTVVEELQRGYLLHGRLLRPALVKVSVDPSSNAGGAGVNEDGISG